MRSWASRSVQELKAHRAEINALNVFPVPDSDTGSNMLHTMEAAIAEAAKLPEAAGTLQVATALAAGAVRGARGNSGMVLSQILRGVAESADAGSVDAKAVARALESALNLVRRSIHDPVEGTVLTVLRAAAVAAEAAVGEGCQLPEVIDHTVAAARKALAITPSQLPALRAAGVVDAGGQGLVLLLEALAAEVSGAAEAVEVMLFVSAASADSLAGLRRELAPMGDSLIVAEASETAATVHIHTDAPDAVLAAAREAGEVSDVRIEELTGSEEPPTRQIIAMVPGEDTAELFRAAGAEPILPAGAHGPGGDDGGGEDPRPDTDADPATAILSAVTAGTASDIVLLPNGRLNKNQLISTELAVRAAGRALVIVPTRNVVTGLAAIAVHNPEIPSAVDATTMMEAATAVRFAQVREAECGFEALEGAREIAVGDSLSDVVSCAVGDLLGAHGELVSVVARPAVAEELSESLAKAIESATNQGVEWEIHRAAGLGTLAEIGVE